MPAFGRQAAPLEGLTGANFINEDEKQILRAKTARRSDQAAFGVLRRVSLDSAGLRPSQDSSLRSE